MSSSWLATGTILGGYQGEELIAVQRLDDLGVGEGWIGGIRVAPEMRRQGIGKDLMDYTLGVVRQWGLKTLRLFIEEGNLPSENLARSNGFHRLLDVAHLAGPVRASTSGPKMLPATEVGPLEVGCCRWIQAFHGFLIPAVRHSNHMVRATQERLQEEVRLRSLYEDPSSEIAFLLSQPESVTWSERPLRAFSPLAGDLEAILDRVGRLGDSDGALLDTFLPVDETVLAQAERAGLIRGALWGRTIGLYELPVR